MGNHDRLRLRPWAGLLLLSMASTVSALSLFNFQQVMSPGVPIGCILAYNSQIPSCTTADFTQGRACSAACGASLQRVQNTLITVCATLDAPIDSVLGQALAGNLVTLLCSSVDTTTSIPSKKTSTASTAQPTTTAPSTSSTLTKITLTTVSSATASPTTQQPPPPPPPPPAPVPEPTLPEGSVPSPSPSQPSEPPAPEETRISGGGSPFDFVRTGGSSRQLGANWMLASAVAVTLGLLLLQ